ncbi:MAG: hypothetical protein KDN19_21670 [Verrucomicrobiae bacterium]|nr:hypothetical protein [Verrucomicrobiae bacterium]
MKRNIRFFRWALVGVALVGCEDTARDSIVIERDARVVKVPHDPYIWEDWQDLENGMVQANFVLPPNYFSSMSPTDPFSSRTAEEADQPNDAKAMLTSYGIVFGDRAAAVYHPESNLLTVTQTPEQMELVAAVFTGRCDLAEPQVHIRTEIYELPEIAALDVLESLRPQGEHTPERAAMLRETRKKKITLVAAPTVIARSGQRAKIQELVGTNSQSAEPSEDETSEPNRDSTPTLSLEVDPIIGADNDMIDVNFQITFAPKDTPLISRELTTQVITHDGDWICAGSWSGQIPETMMLIFINATIQTLGDAGEMVKVRENAEDTKP